MEDVFQKILQEIIPLRPSEGQSKVMPLGLALRKYVQPGLTLHLGITSTPPTAIIYELTRLFRGKDPRFTLVTLGLTTVYSLLVHAGLLEKVITTFIGDNTYFRGYDKVYRELFKQPYPVRTTVAVVFDDATLIEMDVVARRPGG